jgi:hypothetical protein
MRIPCSILVIFVLLGFGTSLAVPAEDVPETAYDESEALPYEGTPLFSIVVPQACARILRTELSCDSLVHFSSSTKRCQPSENNAEARCVTNSLTLLNHFLRC